MYAWLANVIVAKAKKEVGNKQRSLKWLFFNWSVPQLFTVKTTLCLWQVYGLLAKKNLFRTQAWKHLAQSLNTTILVLHKKFWFSLCISSLANKHRFWQVFTATHQVSVSNPFTSSKYNAGNCAYLKHFCFTLAFFTNH